MATTAIGSDRQSGAAFEKYFDAVFMRDDKTFYFGTNGSVGLTYVSATGKLQISGASALDLGFGTIASPLAPTAVNTVLGIFMNPTITASATKNYGIQAECYLNPSDTFATEGAGMYTIRGVAGVKTGATFAGSANQGYLVGVQGKLVINGIMGNNNSGGIYACAVLAQMNIAAAATFGTDAQVYGLWVDNQSTGGTPPATTHMVNITNNGGAVANFFMLYGNNAVTNFMTLGAMGASLVAVSGSTTVKTGALKVVVAAGQNIAAGTYYIPLVSTLA